MVDIDLADPELVLIINITENKYCNDCQKKNPRWCSINNAILLCASCARKHQKYNNIISKIKSLEGDLWTKEEIKKLYIGGNERFNKLLLSYNIPLTNENAEYKYHTKIAGYYRNLLNEELKGQKVINLIKPSLKEGIELINKEDYDKLNQYIPSQDNIIQNNINVNISNNNKNNYSNVLNIPENKNVFANPFASDFNMNNNSNSINNIYDNTYSNKNNNYNGNFEQHLNDFATSMNNVFTNISKKAQNIDYNEKLRNAGEYIKDKKEKIENSETFKGFMSALTIGIDTLVKKTEDFFNDSLDTNLNKVNRDISQEKKNEIRFDNNNQIIKNQIKFQCQGTNNSNYNIIQNSIHSQNNDINNINVNNLNFNLETPNGNPDIPALNEYSNNPQNINAEGGQKNNENNFENLDENNTDKKNKS